MRYSIRKDNGVSDVALKVLEGGWVQLLTPMIYPVILLDEIEAVELSSDSFFGPPVCASLNGSRCGRVTVVGKTKAKIEVSKRVLQIDEVIIDEESVLKLEAEPNHPAFDNTVWKTDDNVDMDSLVCDNIRRLPSFQESLALHQLRNS